MTRFRVAIFGTGFGRTVQALGFQRHAGFDLTAIAGSQQEKTRRLAGELGIPHAFGDWRQLLAEVKPDVVSIATPVDLHHPMMMASLEAGAHVLCEKPTALHRFQAAEMRDRAQALGRVAGINHEFRFFPARSLALRLVQSGGIGAPRRGEILGRYSIWPKGPARGMSWLSDRNRGGGILGALGSHHTDCFRTLFGEPESVIATVRVDQPQRGPTDTQPTLEQATADDGFTLEYRFANGVTGVIDCSATAPYRSEKFEVHGSDASLRWDETGYQLWRLVAGREPEELVIPADLRLAPREGDPALVAPFGVLLDRFHRALTGTRKMDPNFDDAVAVQSALDAVRASSEAGARVRVEIPLPLAKS